MRSVQENSGLNVEKKVQVARVRRRVQDVAETSDKV